MGTGTLRTDGSTTGAVLIRQQYYDQIVNAIYYNGFFGSDLFPKTLAGGDTATRWILRRTAGTPEIFTEGQVQPNPTYSEYSAASVAWTYVRSVLRVSGHVQDAMGSAWAGTSNIMDVEIQTAAMDLQDLLSTSFLGSTYGLENAVAATGTYAGQTRGAIPWFESAVTALNQPVTGSGFLGMLQTLLDNDRGGFKRGGALVMPWNLLISYYTSGNSPIVRQGPATDLAPGLLSATFAGYPIVCAGDMTDTITLFLDTSPGNVEVPVIRPMQTKDLAPSGDDDLVQVSTGACIIIRNPMLCGKLTGLY